MIVLTPTQKKAMILFDEEFKPGTRVYAGWINGTTISKATIQALAKKGYLLLLGVEEYKYTVRGQFGRNIGYKKIEYHAFYKRILNYKGETI